VPGSGFREMPLGGEPVEPKVNCPDLAGRPSLRHWQVIVAEEAGQNGGTLAPPRELRCGVPLDGGDKPLVIAVVAGSKGNVLEGSVAMAYTEVEHLLAQAVDRS